MVGETFSWTIDVFVFTTKESFCADQPAHTHQMYTGNSMCQGYKTTQSTRAHTHIHKHKHPSAHVQWLLAYLLLSFRLSKQDSVCMCVCVSVFYLG